MSERFIKINGYKNYSVSNKGNVRNDKTGRILQTQDNGVGYLILQLHKNGVMKSHKVHRLVCEAFILNPQNKETVNHKDGCKYNNNLDNLEWNTLSENVKHSFDNNHRMAVCGEQHGKSKLKLDEVDVIISAKGVGKQIDIAKFFGVSQSLISKIQGNKIWINN